MPPGPASPSASLYERANTLFRSLNGGIGLSERDGDSLLGFMARVQEESVAAGEPVLKSLTMGDLKTATRKMIEGD